MLIRRALQHIAAAVFRDVVQLVLHLAVVSEVHPHVVVILDDGRRLRIVDVDGHLRNPQLGVAQISLQRGLVERGLRLPHEREGGQKECDGKFHILYSTHIITTDLGLPDGKTSSLCSRRRRAEAQLLAQAPLPIEPREGLSGLKVAECTETPELGAGPLNDFRGSPGGELRHSSRILGGPIHDFAQAIFRPMLLRQVDCAMFAHYTEVLSRAWLIFGIFILYLVHLGGAGMLGPDEPRYASIGRAMAQSGDLITPRLDGRPWFEKPPLIYWTVALGNWLVARRMGGTAADGAD